MTLDSFFMEKERLNKKRQAINILYIYIYPASAMAATRLPYQLLLDSDLQPPLGEINKMCYELL